MKKFTTTLASAFIAVLFISSCSKTSVQDEAEAGFGVFGDSTIVAEGAVDASEIYSLIQGKDSVAIKVKGTINGVCQAKGCWMNMPLSEDEDMTVRFKGYEFFVPKNSSGREAIVEGIAYVDTVSVARLRHKAEDAGELSAEEIAEITEPQISYSLMASGVIIN